jgi:SAM-dependent methyltransferase
MSAVFQEYSNYYDLLNSGKEYGPETAYVLALARREAPDRPLGTVLNLGCGTGCHDVLLAGHGCQVTGVDRSQAMLAIARHTVARAGVDPAPTFVQGDITRLRLGSRFDLVLSLFHVMSYQTSNEALLDSMHTAFAHLDVGGLFIFDFWYGPAVLHERPLVRVKRVEDEQSRIQRITEPVLNENENTVAVNFEVTITDKGDGSCRTLHETHTMRYLFLPEIKALLAQAGFTLLCAEEWLSGQVPSLTTWNVCCVAKKVT